MVFALVGTFAYEYICYTQFTNTPLLETLYTYVTRPYKRLNECVIAEARKLQTRMTALYDKTSAGRGLHTICL